MASRVTVTEAELLSELRAATQSVAPNIGDALTMPEMAEALGIGRQATHARIKRLHRAGQIDVVRVQRMGIDGVIRPLVAYRLKKQGKKR